MDRRRNMPYQSRRANIISSGLKYSVTLILRIMYGDYFSSAIRNCNTNSHLSSDSVLLSAIIVRDINKIKQLVVVEMVVILLPHQTPPHS